MKRLALSLILLGLFALTMQAQNTTGTWTLYPPQVQTPINQVTVQQPINSDGTSVWSASKGVVPVQFSLATGSSYGPVIFSSLFSTGSYSYLDFAPNPSLTFDQITSLIAVYTFTTGNCHGGALRWSVNLDNGTIFIYYGALPNFTDCTTAGASQSGVDMIGQTDLRYDTSQIGGTFYDTYANAQTLAVGHAVTSVSLVLEAGWAGDQVLTLGNVTVNDNTFVPNSSSSLTPTCTLPPANIEVDRLEPTPTGPIGEVTAIQPNDVGSAFRIVDCKYMYNLAAKPLGQGQYEVKVIINGVPASGSGKFTLK